MSTEIKAYACGLTTNEFIFFARVVEGEGADSDSDITDKVLVAATVLNRINCSSWPTRTVMTTLQRPGQFEVVDQETGVCNCARSLDSEWAIVIAYRMVANNELDCHMVYYNALDLPAIQDSLPTMLISAETISPLSPVTANTAQRLNPAG